ncbi:MAG: ABC transporter substrate-binding protein [candidate division NC10 bacterium]|nr:ABC transporter substrate-binding protein [candidate division NC10 bacterium]
MKFRTAGLIVALALVLVLFTAPVAAEAQQASKVARIGYLSSHSPERFRVEAFRQALHEFGWVEGGNLIIDYRSADGKFDRLPDLAAELVGLKVDVIVAVATVPALAAKRATQTIPIVFTHVSDPVGSGLVPSLARPGNNITGFTHINAALSPKRLEILKQAVPKVTHVAALWHPGGLGEHTERTMLRETEDAARALGVHLQFIEARGPHDFDRAFAAVTRERAGALSVLPSPIFLNEPRRIVDFVARTRVPAVYFAREFAEAGGLMAYGADMADIVRGAARYVDKILKGAKPADLPVEQGSKFELVINLKTAKALGLTIPQSILLRADDVIQ